MEGNVSAPANFSIQTFILYISVSLIFYLSPKLSMKTGRSVYINTTRNFPDYATLEGDWNYLILVLKFVRSS